MAAATRIRLISICLALLILATNSVNSRWAGSLPLVPEGRIRVGIDPSLAPFAYYEGEEIIGFELDLVRVIATTLELDIEWVGLGIDGIYDALRAERADLVIAALSPDPLRTRDAAYSRPYYDAGLVLVSPELHPVTSMENTSGLRIAYAFGSHGHTEADRWLRRIAPFTPLPYELPEIALEAVRLAQADAALVGATDAQLYQRAHPTWRAALVSVTHQPFVIAVAPRLAERLLPAINAVITDLEETGTLAMLRRRWLY